MPTNRPKKVLDRNVYEESLDRIRYLFDSFDKVTVSFSGGKDSTVVLNLALIVAKEKGKLPLEVDFFDEEAIHPPTIEYVERVRQIPEIKLNWYCLEFKHRNAASNVEPFWYCWDSKKKDKWVRPMPEWGITEHPYFTKGMTFQDFAEHQDCRGDGRVVRLTGIRTQESLTRYRIIASKKNESYLNSKNVNGTSTYKAHPIYDWSSKDVWIPIKQFGWDYNKTYDLFNKTRNYNNFLAQRVCPPFGEEPLKGLWVYAECFPEMWHKMLYRVEGVNTAWRYSRTELYNKADVKPEHITYRKYLDVIIDSYAVDLQNVIKRIVNQKVREHYGKTDMPIDDTIPHPVSGVCWRLLCKVAMRGNFKGRLAPLFTEMATKRRKELGITLEEAKVQYGK